MRNLSGLPIDDDLIDRILFHCPNFDTLRAFILTCKAIHGVYLRYPKSIARAVAYNVAGPALPQAMRLIRYNITKDDDDAQGTLNLDPLSVSDSNEKIPLTSQEVKSLVEVAGTASRLEDVFSWTCKSKLSKISMLSADESWRFRRGIYRLMLYCATFGPLGFSYDDDENPYLVTSEVTDEAVQALQHKRKAFLKEFDSLELLEIRTVVTFLKDFLNRIDTYLDHDLIDPDFDMFEYTLSLGPSAILECYEERSLSGIHSDWTYVDINFEAVSGFLESPLTSIFAERKTKMPNNEWEPILDEVIGETDQCHQCCLVLGMKLWGKTNWDFLRGATSPSNIPALVKGNLIQNAAYSRRIREVLCDSSDFEFSSMVSEMFDLKTAEYLTWNKDDWLCLTCLEKFIAAYFHIWFVEHRRIQGQPVPSENCWYGYNCRTQTHNYEHAARLNHFCEPTKGD